MLYFTFFNGSNVWKVDDRSSVKIEGIATKKPSPEPKEFEYWMIDSLIERDKLPTATRCPKLEIIQLDSQTSGMISCWFTAHKCGLQSISVAFLA